MAELVNLTPFAATCIPSLGLDDEELALLVVVGRFRLPPPSQPQDEPTLCEGEAAIPLEDRYHGAPGHSSLYWEGQSSLVRPATDIYLSGHAWAPQGRPLTETTVALELGPCRQTALVYGDRSWRRGVTGLVPSTPARFERMPLVYERCFGGFVEGARSATLMASERNPLGVGLLAQAGAPLPNLDDPRAPIRSPRDRPAPRGFGPVARHWLPRRALGGSYDEAWVDSRAPLWPRDIDTRFFMAAAEPLQAPRYLVGGESIVILGMHPDGTIACRLPTYRLMARFELRRAQLRRALELDAIMVEPDELELTMVWRASIAIAPTILALDRLVVRALEAWESHE